MNFKLKIKSGFNKIISTIKANKELLFSKGSCWATELFQYCIALMPVLCLLNVPLLNISLGTVLLILFLPYSALYVMGWFKRKDRESANFVDWFKKKIKDPKNFAIRFKQIAEEPKKFVGMILFAIFYLYMCARSGGGLLTIIMSLLAMVHIWGMFCGSVQFDKIRRILVTYAMISVGLLVIQTLAYYLLDFRIQYIPQALVHEQFRESYVFRETSGLFRPSALFLEPAHFVQYCIFAIISVLFPPNGKVDLERAIVLAIGCVLTTSGMGMALVFGIAVWYFILKYVVTGKLKNYRLKKILLVALACVVGLFLIAQIPFIKLAILRVFSTVDGYNAVVGRLGLWKLKDAIGTMKIVPLLFGYNNTADYGYYLTGLIDTIYKFGLVGLLSLLSCFGWLMYCKKSNYVWGTCLTFLALFVVAHLTTVFAQLFYFGIVISNVIAAPKLDEKKEVSPEQIKEIGYRILCDVAAFCEKNGIQYSLACGTTLGAIRHNGFIPWDDDVDICMPRADYERFLDMYVSEKYEIYDTRYQKNYPFTFAKVCDRGTVLVEHMEKPCLFGVYIDIFPIDGLPSDELQRKKHMKKLGWDFRLLAWKRMPKDKKMDFLHKLILITAKAVLHAVPIRFLVWNLEHDVKKYSYARSEYAGHLVSPSPWGNDIKPKSVFENPVRHKFEDSEFFVPGDVDQYLTLEYGDYMQLPPVEKQVSMHDFVAYYKGE